MSKDTGGPAFPQAFDSDFDRVKGMTLRDYFAAKAMQGFACDDNATWVDGVTGMASCAYTWADAMLAERAK